MRGSTPFCRIGASGVGGDKFIAGARVSAQNCHLLPSFSLPLTSGGALRRPSVGRGLGVSVKLSGREGGREGRRSGGEISPSPKRRASSNFIVSSGAASERASERPPRPTVVKWHSNSRAVSQWRIGSFKGSFPDAAVATKRAAEQRRRQLERPTGLPFPPCRPPPPPAPPARQPPRMDGESFLGKWQTHKSDDRDRAKRWARRREGGSRRRTFFVCDSQAAMRRGPVPHSLPLALPLLSYLIPLFLLSFPGRRRRQPNLTCCLTQLRPRCGPCPPRRSVRSPLGMGCSPPPPPPPQLLPPPSSRPPAPVQAVARPRRLRERETTSASVVRRSTHSQVSTAHFFYGPSRRRRRPRRRHFPTPRGQKTAHKDLKEEEKGAEAREAAAAEEEGAFKIRSNDG